MYTSEYVDTNPHIEFTRYIEAYKKLAPWEMRIVTILQKVWVKVFNFKSKRLQGIIIDAINYTLARFTVLENIAHTLAQYYAALLPPEELMVLYKTEDEAQIARADKLVEEWLQEAQRVMDTYCQRMEKLTKEQSH